MNFFLMATGIVLLLIIINYVWGIIADNKTQRKLSEQLDSAQKKMENATIIVFGDNKKGFSPPQAMDGLVERQIFQDMVDGPEFNSIINKAYSQGRLSAGVVANLAEQMRNKLMDSVPVYHIPFEHDEKGIQEMLKGHFRTARVGGFETRRYTLLSSANHYLYVRVPTRLESGYKEYANKQARLERDKASYLRSLSSSASVDKELVEEYDRRIKEARELHNMKLENLLFEAKAALDEEAIEKDSETTIEAWERLYKQD